MEVTGDISKSLVEAARQTLADVTDLVNATETVAREYEQLRVHSRSIEQLQEDLRRAHEGLRQALEELKQLREAHQTLVQEHEHVTQALREVRARQDASVQDRRYVLQQLEAAVRRLKEPEAAAV